MKIIRYDSDQTPTGPIIFLAGPTVRGHQTHLGDSWRRQAIREFESLGFEGTLVLPEFTNKFFSDKGVSWLPDWEYNWLHTADKIIFWIPRTRDLIGLTTNFEFGFWVAKNPEKVIYGAPPDAYRNEYLDIMWKRAGQNIKYNTLQETITATVLKL